MVAKKKAEPKPDLLGEFPLPAGHYFHPPVVSPRAHDGANTADRTSLLALQRLLGAPQTGAYDDDTVESVVAWKVGHGLDRSPVVDHETWQRLRRG